MTDTSSPDDFSLTHLLETVFQPLKGCRIALMIDLQDPRDIIEWGFLDAEGYAVQKRAYQYFYQPLQKGGLNQIGCSGGDAYAYRTTGGSNLDLPDEAVTPDGETVSLSADVYPYYDLILCISDYSATAPLTAFAKKYGFRGATLHGVNDVILSSGLCRDYNEVAREAELLRAGLTRADAFEIDFECAGRTSTLRLITDGQEAQKSQGLCIGTEPDVANLPAGEVYYVPAGAEGIFPMIYEDEERTLSFMKVENGHIVDAEFIRGNEELVEEHKRRMASDPATGEIGELGLGTQNLPFSGADIQDEKVRGTVHVATGRSDHLGGDLTPDKFADAGNATHDDILFHPQKTPEILVKEVRMERDGETRVVINDYKPAAYMQGLLQPS